MMKNSLLIAGLLIFFVGCNNSTDTYTPKPHEVCGYVEVLNEYGYSVDYVCYIEFYNQNGDIEREFSLDIAADVSDSEERMIERNAIYYSEKFSLSTTQSMKIARQVADVNKLEERTLEDIADFGKKLYGIDTTKAISAAGKAQMGDHTELDALIRSAASKLEISQDNMKGLLKELHGKALRENGINF